MLALAFVGTFVFGLLVGAGITSVLYERNTIGALKRSNNVKRISQLDVFELPEKLRESIPPEKRSPSPLPTSPSKQ